MSVMRKEVYDAFRAAGVPDEKAAAAAEAIEASREEGYQRIGDELRGLEGRVRDELRGLDGRVRELDGRVRELDGRVRHVEQGLLRLDGRVTLLTWMVGFDLALTVAILAKLLFVH